MINGVVINDKYLWCKQKGQYKQWYYINTECKPYYIGNNKQNCINFKPIDETSDIWKGNIGQNEIKIHMIELPSISKDSQYNSSFFIKEESILKKLSRSDVHIFNYKKFLENNEQQSIIKICNVYFNEKKINKDICIICDEDTITKINYQIKTWKSKMRKILCC